MVQPISSETPGTIVVPDTFCQSSATFFVRLPAGGRIFPSSLLSIPYPYEALAIIKLLAPLESAELTLVHHPDAIRIIKEIADALITLRRH